MRKTYTTTISLPPLLAKKAQRVMQKEGRTRSELFREALRRYLVDIEEEIIFRELQESRQEIRAGKGRVLQSLKDLQ